MLVMRKRHGLTGAKRRSLTIRLFGDKSGAAAVEFAIVAPVFIAMMFSLYEVGWYFYQVSIIDTATGDAGRMIETGQVQKLSLTNEQKKQVVYNQVCSVMSKFGDCAERLTVEVRTFNTFAELAAASTTIPTVCADVVDAQTNSSFSPGADQDIVWVRTCFLYSPVNPAIGLNFADAGSDYRKLTSIAIFCNEPYSTGSGGGAQPNPCGT